MSKFGGFLRSKWRVCAVAAVVATGLAWVSKDRMPVLGNLPASPKTGTIADPGLRDAVASPGMVPGAVGWFQGAAALSRVAHSPDIWDRTKAALPPRPTWGRAVFSGKRVIVDQVWLGVPEPTLKPGPDDNAQILSSRLENVASAFLAQARRLNE
jgi:hypothetical protein